LKGVGISGSWLLPPGKHKLVQEKKLIARLSLATIVVNKYSLGTRGRMAQPGADGGPAALGQGEIRRFSVFSFRLSVIGYRIKLSRASLELTISPLKLDIIKHNIQIISKIFPAPMLSVYHGSDC
jgi:hypothetical protein